MLASYKDLGGCGLEHLGKPNARLRTLMAFTAVNAHGSMVLDKCFLLAAGTQWYKKVWPGARKRDFQGRYRRRN